MKLIASMWMLFLTMVFTQFSTISKSVTTMVEWNLEVKKITLIKISFLMNFKSIMFSTSVIIIFTSIALYSSFYMKNNKMEWFFQKTMFMFMTSMIILIMSMNMTSMITGWEGLGITSMILITFYNTHKTSSSAYQTMMINRIGDVSMLMAMALMMNLNSWVLFKTSKSSEMISLLIIIGAFSKSAQIPFSSWLTEAMMAPTPVSALVHSSTLVTAGVYVLIIMNEFTKSMKTKKIIFYISMMTLTMASLNSILEWDMKKIIALSTLSQLSLMFISISLNLMKISFFHLILHAMFKSLLFLCSSSIIMMNNTQDIRAMEKPSNHQITNTSFNIASLTLVGMPYLSSFYSKDILMETMLTKNQSMMSNVMFFSMMSCSLIYSIKMMEAMNNKENFKTKMSSIKEQAKIKMSKISLIVPASFMGNVTNWKMNMMETVPILSKTKKLFISLIILSLIIIKIKTNNKKTMQKKVNNLMWTTKNMSSPLKSFVMMKLFKMMKITEKGKFEAFFKLLKKMMKEKSVKNFKISKKNFTHNLSSLSMSLSLMFI